ncbi:MAG: 23S rRNA (pseudouridine(1915)-N(3))-methyltransferase RlmH [Alphaproteobacteria bacterium]|nr:23S rRNA (pseudouridine(1915)-N(3))-methyltransferase RlmH [Alphaproteobacteria bacterium]
MRITLAAVGKAKAGAERDLFRTYVDRINKWKFDLKEVEEKRPLPSNQKKDKEAELLLGTVPDGAFVIVLDERGKELTSIQFSKTMERLQDDGYKDLVIMIGGADGHGNDVLQRANLKLCFGRMTWPHMMVRAMIAEQVFRAQSILNNHPYHRE